LRTVSPHASRLVSPTEARSRSISPAVAARWAKRLGYVEAVWVELALQNAIDTAGLKLRIRVGLVSRLTAVHPEVEAAVRRAAACLTSLGHDVDEGPPPPDIGVDEFLPIMGRLMANVPLPPFTSQLLQPATRFMREVGRRVSNREASEQRHAMQERIDAWFLAGDADAWVLPTCAVLPPRVGQFAGLDGEQTSARSCPSARSLRRSMLGQPAIRFAAARAKNGLPIGVQLVGKRGHDRALLALAAALEPLLRQ
jgi:Asp-tRNA(Asn)/Glu-tRNA(Gln) amidotransferase A subunit family amidase